MSILTRAQGLLAVGFGFALVSCSLDETKSDLITEGPPRVITVTVLSEADGEAATYCAAPDSGEKVNAYYCPTTQDEVDDFPARPIIDAVPIGWQLRVIFNEHLQADQVEDILACVDRNHNGQCDESDLFDGYMTGSLINTQPVELTCAGEPVPYDGYYDLSGNHLSDPGGPALIIQPIFPEGFVATSTTDCQVTVKSSVLDKDGNAIAADQRGPYSFGIAPLVIEDTAPAPPEDDDPPEVVDPTASLSINFNAYIDPASLTDTILLDQINADDTVTPVPITTTFDPENEGDVVLVTPDADLEPGAEYRLTVMAGVQDIEGGTLNLDAPYTVPFTTAASN